jgi:hypothetical protein
MISDAMKDTEESGLLATVRISSPDSFRTNLLPILT